MKDKYKIELVKKRNVWVLVDTSIFLDNNHSLFKNNGRIIDCATDKETLEIVLHDMLLTEALNDKEYRRMYNV